MLPVKQLLPHTPACFVVFKNTEPGCYGLVVLKRREKTPLGISPWPPRPCAAFHTLWQWQSRQSGCSHCPKGTQYEVEENRQRPETDTTYCIGAQAVREEPTTGKDLGEKKKKPTPKQLITSAWLQRKNWSFFTRLCFITSSPIFAAAGFLIWLWWLINNEDYFDCWRGTSTWKCLFLVILTSTNLSMEAVWWKRK